MNSSVVFLALMVSSLLLLGLNSRLRSDRRGVHWKVHFQDSGIDDYDLAVHSGLWFAAAYFWIRGDIHLSAAVAFLSLTIGLITLLFYVLFGPVPPEEQIWYMPGQVTVGVLGITVAGVVCLALLIVFVVVLPFLWLFGRSRTLYELGGMFES